MVSLAKLDQYKTMKSMKERYKIFVEQLRDGQIEKLEETFPPALLDVNEKDLSFSEPIKVSGEAYLADADLVLHLNAHTMATIPCRVCNESVKVPIGFEGFYHAVPLDDVKTGVYEYKDILRETLLLEVPALAECNQGKCPQRKTMDKYFKKEHPGNADEIEEGYQPFANLDIELGKTKNEKKKKN